MLKSKTWFGLIKQMMVFSKVKISAVSGTPVASAYSDSYSIEVTGTQESQRTWSNAEKLGAMQY